ncbi:hypothetical protein [Catellatospora vulcania]|uniref:hypothetical protein n=1 Tax=Catellatospora vulcania TaxID=1460450 RepID=UPI0012D3DC69|nr:hypothetical protein [Catellatospora vulcania]
MADRAATRVLVIVGTVPKQQAALAAKLAQLRAMGAEVMLACNFDPALLTVDTAPATRTALTSADGEYNAWLRGALEVASGPRKVWLLTRRNAAVRRYARQADVLVALDHLAVYAIWELAQRHRRPAAVYGIEASVQAVTAHRSHPDQAARGLLPSAPAWGGVAVRDAGQAALTSAAFAAGATLSPTVMRTSVGARFWGAMVALPRIPDPVRRHMAFTVHANMLKAGRADAAAKVSARARRRIRDRHVLADLLLREAAEQARYGATTGMAAAMQANLAVADAHLPRREFTKSAAAVHRALAVLFDRRLHRDRPATPLADDPAGYLAAWRQSTSVQRLTAPRGRSAQAAPVPAGRPVRVLLLADRADDAIEARGVESYEELLRRYERDSRVEVQAVDLAALEEFAPFRPGDKQIVEHLVTGGSVYGNKLEALLRPHLSWADVVLVEGGGSAAAALGLLDPADTRVVIRLHGAETLSAWPHLMDFTRVDDLALSGPAAEKSLLALLPQLADGPRRHVLGDATAAEDLDAILLDHRA